MHPCKGCASTNSIDCRYLRRIWPGLFARIRDWAIAAATAPAATVMTTLMAFRSVLGFTGGFKRRSRRQDAGRQSDFGLVARLRFRRGVLVLRLVLRLILGLGLMLVLGLVLLRRRLILLRLPAVSALRIVVLLVIAVVVILVRVIQGRRPL